MNISVVIATHNRKEKLRHCIAAITRQTHPASQIIVVDDASTDGTGAMLEAEFPHVEYVRLEANQGPAVARNRGIRIAHEEIIAFTDDDCLPPPNWLEQLSAGFTDYPQVVGVGGYQDPPKELIRHNPIARAEHLDRLQRWGESAERPQCGGYEVPGFGTNNAAYKRRVLLEVGGFDETFPVAAGEDADLKWRITEKGYKLLYLPLKVEHHRAYTWRAQWHSSIRRGIGAYYFELQRGHPPGLGRITLRLGKRLWKFFPDLIQLPWPAAPVNLFSRLGDVLGQYRMAVRNHS